MTLVWVLVAVAVVLLLVGAYASWTAGRLDRLHHRVESSRAALETELARRAALVAELAGAGILDPASSLLLLDAAHRARTASPEEREQRESALTRAINATGTEVEPWAGELSLAMRRVQLARRFHNDIVVTTRNLRRRRLVTWLHLAGHAPIPDTIELEDGS
ncbi:membrane protein [Kribbella swartbergensis]